jgi:hypothetical protein
MLIVEGPVGMAGVGAGAGGVGSAVHPEQTPRSNADAYIQRIVDAMTATQIDPKMFVRLSESIGPAETATLTIGQDLPVAGIVRAMPVVNAADRGQLTIIAALSESTPQAP